MPRKLSHVALALVLTGLTAVPGTALAKRTMDLYGRDDPRRSVCDIVVRQPGGNPTQDMTGSIGHTNSHLSNGGVRNPLICYLPGTR